MANFFPELRRSHPRRLALLALAALLGAARPAVPAAQPEQPTEAQPISEAEQRLFVDPHLQRVAAATTIDYRYERSGSLGSGFEDQVRLVLGAPGRARQAHVEFLSGTRALQLPDVEAPNGNPVVLFFLERDVHEMERLTGGKANYFRKRVRLALANAAQVRPATIQLDGHAADAVTIELHPYEDDPMRQRFARYVDKAYLFTLSPQVPGTVYEIRTVMHDPKAPDGAPLVEERLTYTGTTR